MREILFRGKRLDTGEWVYGYYCKHIKRQVCPMGDELKPEDIAHLIINDGFADWNMPRSLQAYDVDLETVGQYTGLKDKNNKKIFAGDVLYDDHWEVYGIVVFDDGGFRVNICNLSEDLFEFTDCPIAGNIHDNPELLEVED